MHPCKGIFLSCNPNTSLRPLYIFPVQVLLQHLIIVQISIQSSYNWKIQKQFKYAFYIFRMIWKYLDMFKR